MQVEPPTVPLFASLSQSLPSQTIHHPLKQPSAIHAMDSPSPEIPNLPKNAYGLESFADYCSAVNRVKAGLPAIEAVTPPDRSEPLIIQGIKFKYWDTDHTVSETSDTDSEFTALQAAQESVKSTWSAGSPRKSILRQSTSSPLICDSEQPLLGERQNLVCDYASSASPASRAMSTSRLSGRRVSVDAGVQSEPMDLQNNEEEVLRIAAEKRLSTRRSSIAPVRRRSCVHGLAGFTGVGCADSGAVICVANGKKFELIVDTCARDDANEIAVQCSGLEIDSEVEALFGQKHEEEVIDVDAEDGNDQDGDTTTKNDAQTDKEAAEVPSPEQLRSNNVAFRMSEANAIPTLDDVVVPALNDFRKMTLVTPVAVTPQSDEQDTTFNGTVQDEIVAKSAHTTSKRLIPPPTLTPRARVSAPPRIIACQQTTIRNIPGSQEDAPPEVRSPETAPAEIKFVEQPQSTPAHAAVDPIKTPSQSNTLHIVRQRSLSLKPANNAPSATPAMQAVHGRTLQVGVLRGVDIHPTASAYQLAAMATLSPRSYIKALQPPQSRVVFAFASPGGTGPIGGVNVAPPNLMSTPPVATLGVAPDSMVRASLVAAPRRSHVSLPRIEQSPSHHDRFPDNGAQHGAGSNAITPYIDPDTETPIAPLPNTGQNSESVHAASERTDGTIKVKQSARSHADPDTNNVVVSTGGFQDVEAHQVDFIDDGDDDFGALPELDDEFLEIETDAEPKAELEPKPDVVQETANNRSRKTSMASSKTHASKKTKNSSSFQRERSSSATQVVRSARGDSGVTDFSNEHVEVTDANALEVGHKEEDDSSKKKPAHKKRAPTKRAKKVGQKTTKRTGQKRWRELKSLPTHQVNLNEGGEEENGLRRSKRQRFPRLKFWKNETVSYERRLSQAIPTIAEVIVEVGGNSESDDDTWFGRR